MRPQHPGNAPGKTVKPRITKGRGRNHTFSGPEVSGARPWTTGDGIKEQRHPRPPISSSRKNSKLRSADSAGLGVTCCGVGPGTGRTPSALAIPARRRPESGAQRLEPGGRPAPLRRPRPGGPRRRSTSAERAHFRLRGTNESAAAVSPALVSGPRLSAGGPGPFGLQGLVSIPGTRGPRIPALGSSVRWPFLYQARGNAQWLGL